MSDSASERSRNEAERLTAKGRYKDALREAKICFKRSGKAADRLRLERLYRLRAQQLAQAGLLDSAREVVDNLIGFGVTREGWSSELAWLMTRLGRGAEARRLAGVEGAAGIDLLEADRAVLDAHRQVADGGIAAEARGIRESLQAILEGEPERGLDLLRELPWSSPLAEWKLFARGLAALRRGDLGGAQANWGRLDPGRGAARIAAKLSGLAAAAPQHDGEVVDAWEERVLGEPISGPVRNLGSLALAGDWAQFTSVLGRAGRALEPLDPTLRERLTALALGPLARSVAGLDRDQAKRRVEAFIAVARPLAIDPRWNRFWAFTWSGPHAEKKGMLAYWGRYLEDLDDLALFDPATRALAKALVWRRIAEGFMAASEPPMFGAALECLDSSLAIAPDLVVSHRLRLEILELWGDPVQFEAAARRLLEVVPDDPETLLKLARHHLNEGEPEPALERMLEARRLRPLDRGLFELEAHVRLELARDLAKRGLIDRARAELERAAELAPVMLILPEYLARLLALDCLVGGDAPFDKAIAIVVAGFVEPAALFLATLIELVRHDAHPDYLKHFADSLAFELKRSFRSEEALALARVLEVSRPDGTVATRLSGLLEQVRAWIQGPDDADWRQIDLENVCEHLSRSRASSSELGRLLKAGLRDFPESAALNLHAAELEIRLHGAARAPGARPRLTKALGIARAASDAELERRIESQLVQLDALAPAGPQAPVANTGRGQRKLGRTR